MWHRVAIELFADNWSENIQTSKNLLLTIELKSVLEINLLHNLAREMMTLIATLLYKVFCSYKYKETYFSWNKFETAFNWSISWFQ